MVKVFIIDSHPVFRLGLGSILDGKADFQVVGDAPGVPESLERIEQAQPDIVLLDVSASADGAQSIIQIQERCPRSKVIALTDSDKRDDFFKVIQAGAKGYLLNNLDFIDFIESIHLVASGNAIVYSAMAARLLSAPEGLNKEPQNGLSTLSARERQVLALVARGSTNKEIAVQCCVSPTTVKAHLRRILEKLEVKNRAQTVALAMEKGFLTQSRN